MMTWMVAALVGAFFWTFAEYALHNWYGHVAKGANEFSREHLQHHAVKDYFTPTPKKIAMAMPALAAIFALGSIVVHWSTSMAFTLGFGGMYTFYEWLHRRMHTHPPRHAYARMMWRHHFYHHFKRPNMNHGVTTPLWDIVFRTYVRPPKIRVPEKHAMEWLTDASGALRPEFAAEYEIARRRRAAAAPAAEAGTPAT